MTRRRPNRLKVLEGNPGHRSRDELAEGVTLPPGAPPEPAWSAWFPPARGDRAQQAAAKRLRAWARDEWRRVVPVLDGHGLLASVDAAALADLCVATARLWHCEREISLHGVAVDGHRGPRTNPHVTAANQLRARVDRLRGQFGLTPLARDALGASAWPSATAGGDAIADNPFAQPPRGGIA